MQQLNRINSQTKSSQALRVLIEAGGCHGYQYVMSLTDAVAEDDVTFEKDGAKVVVDEVSLKLVEGSTLEYVNELIGSSFQLTGNPKAESSCGCKTSFSINQ
ncbi:[4Fe-4S] proteins maturation [Irineochytrium annulatum]|nr:[4Fe-4S] proteins maturation [Irineochytrium annulatum]